MECNESMILFIQLNMMMTMPTNSLIHMSTSRAQQSKVKELNELKKRRVMYKSKSRSVRKSSVSGMK